MNEVIAFQVRIGHFAEAQILEHLGVDMIDESEVLSPADDEHHIDKGKNFKVPFVCGARNLGEALRRISEGAAMIRTKGEAGTGNVVNAVHHARVINREIRLAQVMDSAELYSYSKHLQVPLDLLRQTARLGRLPVVNFAAGGLATPADCSMLMQPSIHFRTLQREFVLVKPQKICQHADHAVSASYRHAGGCGASVQGYSNLGSLQTQIQRAAIGRVGR